MSVINLPTGKYIVATSGGVDSVSLLNMLASDPELELVVAHFDHGIRPDSADDAAFVESLAAKYGLKFVADRADLGPNASEDQSRIARYRFLRKAVAQESAQAMILGHHRGDVIETAAINISRGTGRRGLSSLKSTADIVRPLLHLTKQEILDYAQSNELKWREDSTNNDPKYLRNKIRLQVLDESASQKLGEIIDTVSVLNQQIDMMLKEYLTRKSHKREGLVYSRYWFNGLPHDLCREIVHYWFAENRLHNYDQKLVEYAVIKLKTLRAGKSVQLGPNSQIDLTKRSIRLQFHNIIPQ